MRSTDALAQLLARPGDALRLRTARVDGYTATSATITLAGGTVTDVPYLASYAPAVGNTVLLLQTTNGLLLIIGRVA
jgi:hypothetical protein